MSLLSFGPKQIFMKNQLLLIISLIIIGLTSCNNEEIILFEEDCDSGCKIVTCQEPDSVTLLAAQELQKYLFEIGAKVLPIITDTGEVIPPSIILGKNKWYGQVEGEDPQLQDNCEFYDEFNLHDELFDLGDDGYIIKTTDGNLIIAGNTSYGILNGVYGFLEDYLDCRMYTPDFKVIPKQDQIVLGKIDDKQIPVFTFRELHFKAPLTSPEFRLWHKLNKKTDERNLWGHMWVHTFDDLIPAEKYFDEHPEYFSELNGKRIPGGQICLSNPEVFDVLVANLDSVIKQNPDANFWSVSQNDNYLACQCDECKEMDEKYGGPSGTMIDFVNKVAREYPYMIISTLAYQYTRSAPENIIPEDNVNIMLCSIECDRSKPIEEEKGKNTFAKDLKEWGVLSDNILIWDYVVQFRNLVSPFPNFHVLQPNLEFFAENNAFMMFQQGCGNNVGEFYELRTYIITKLLWKPDLDVGKIIKDFTDAYYGDAAPYIQEYIEKTHDELIKSGKGLNIYGYPYDGLMSYLTPELIKEYSSLFDEAEKAVDKHPEILERVKNARLPLEYAILEISMRNIDDDLTFFIQENGEWSINPEMRKRLINFTEQAKKAGITRFTEHGKFPDEYHKAMLNYVDNSMKENLSSRKNVNIKTEYSTKYPVGGGKALTDGLIGTLDFHFNWLGFEGENMEAIVDLESVKEIREIKTTFLQEYKSWIFLPVKVSFYASENGDNYKLIETVINEVPDNKPDIFIEGFTIHPENLKARYIKIYAESMKQCPDWHIGAGGKCWIFIDEAIIN